MSLVYFIAAYDQIKHKNWMDQLKNDKTIRVKIGGTSRAGVVRLSELQTGNGFKLCVIGVIRTSGDFRDMETHFQNKFGKKRVLGEWFSLDDKDIDRIYDLIELYDIIYKQAIRIEKIEDFIKNMSKPSNITVDVNINQPSKVTVEKPCGESLELVKKFIEYIKRNRPSWYCEDKWIDRETLKQHYERITNKTISDVSFKKIVCEKVSTDSDRKTIDGKRRRVVKLKSIDSLSIGEKSMDTDIIDMDDIDSLLVEEKIANALNTQP